MHAAPLRRAIVRSALLLGLGLVGTSCDPGSGAPAPTPSARPAGVLTGPSQGVPPAPSAQPPLPTPPSEVPPGADSAEPNDGRAEGVDDVAGRDSDLPLDCPPPEAALDPVQILRFQFTSAVESKQATDKLNVARPGQRVWAHLTVRNRTGRTRCLRLAFRVNDKERTSVVLEVGHSWSWRTWAYNTLRDVDRSGRLELEVTDERGKRIALERLPIVPGPTNQ